MKLKTTPFFVSILICFFAATPGWSKAIHGEGPKTAEDAQVPEQIRQFFAEQFAPGDATYQALAEHLAQKVRSRELLNQQNAKQQLDEALKKLGELRELRTTTALEAEALRETKSGSTYRDENLALVAQKERQVVALDEQILDALEEALLIPFLAHHDKPVGYSNTLVKRAIFSLAIPSAMVGVGSLEALGAYRADSLASVGLAAFVVLSGGVWGTVRIKDLLNLWRNKQSHLALEAAKQALLMPLAQYHEQFAQRCNLLLIRARVSELSTAEEEIPIEWSEVEEAPQDLEQKRARQ